MCTKDAIVKKENTWTLTEYVIRREAHRSIVFIRSEFKHSLGSGFSVTIEKRNAKRVNRNAKQKLVNVRTITATESAFSNTRAISEGCLRDVPVSRRELVKEAEEGTETRVSRRLDRHVARGKRKRVKPRRRLTNVCEACSASARKDSLSGHFHLFIDNAARSSSIRILTFYLTFHKSRKTRAASYARPVKATKNRVYAKVVSIDWCFFFVNENMVR